MFALIIIAGAIVFLSISILFSISYINLRVVKNEPMNREPSLIFRLRPLFKTLMVLATCFSTHLFGAQLIIIGLLSLIEWLFWLFSNPFYNAKVASYYQLWSSFLVWTTIVGLTSRFLGVIPNIDGVVCWLVGIPFIVSIVFCYHRISKLKKKSGIICSELNHKTFKTHLIFTYESLDKYIKSKNNATILTRSILEHRCLCDLHNCPLAKVDINAFANFIESQKVQTKIFQGLEELFNKVLSVSSKSNQIRLFYIVLLVEHMEKYKEALIQIAMFNLGNSSIEEILVLTRYKLIIQHKFLKKTLMQSNATDPVVRELIGTEEMISKVMSQLSTTTNIKIEIINELIQEKPDLVKQCKLSTEYALLLQDLQMQWKHIANFNFADTRLYQIYRKFASLILLNSELASKVANKMYLELAFNQKSLTSDLYEIEKQLSSNLNVAIVCQTVSGHTAYWKVSKNYAVLLGYEESELEKRSLDIVMPNAFKARSNLSKNLINPTSLIKNGTQNFEKESKVFLKRKTGFILQVDSKTNFIHALRENEHGVFFLHSFQPVIEPMPSMHLLCNVFYQITDWSSSARLWMKNVYAQLKSGVMNMEAFEPKFSTDPDCLRSGRQRLLSIGNTQRSSVCHVAKLKTEDYMFFTPQVTLSKNAQLKPLTIFHVKYTISPISKASFKNKIVKLIASKESSNLFQGVDTNIWSHYDPKLCFRDAEAQRFSKEFLGWDDSLEDGKNQSKDDLTKTVRTKQLRRGKVIEMEVKEFDLEIANPYQNNSLQSNKQTKSDKVFASSSEIASLNKQEIPVKNPERIFARILKKKKANFLSIAFIILQVAWVAGLVASVVSALVIFKADSSQIISHISDDVRITELIEKSTYLNDHLIDLDFLSRNITFRDRDPAYKREYVFKWTESFSNYLGVLSSQLSQLRLNFNSELIKPVFFKVFKASYLSYRNIFLTAPAWQDTVASLPEFPPGDSDLITDQIVAEREHARSPSKIGTDASIGLKSDYFQNLNLTFNNFNEDANLIGLSVEQMFENSQVESLFERLILKKAIEEFGHGTAVTEDLVGFDKAELPKGVGFESVG